MAGQKIVIDPGHGGSDTGAVGQAGLEEADVNLAISQKLAAYLDDFDIQTLLTRTTDIYIELSYRASVSNSWNADYFVSVHQNSNSASACGIECLYTSEAGKALATPIQACMVAATGDVDRGLVYRSDLYVLSATACPATIVESAFISHPPTEQKLATDEYKSLLAEAIGNGILEHLNGTLKEMAGTP
jgi:N-acetylmuramoyl-L-alanine amidase